jgi:hypothetical protein
MKIEGLIQGVYVYFNQIHVYGGWASMFKTKKPSYVTLSFVWNYVKLTYTTCIVMKIKSMIS